jgi:hypothetical protein
VVENVSNSSKSMCQWKKIMRFNRIDSTFVAPSQNEN